MALQVQTAVVSWQRELAVWFLRQLRIGEVTDALRRRRQECTESRGVSMLGVWSST
jgi:hypothetical protein